MFEYKVPHLRGSSAVTQWLYLLRERAVRQCITDGPHNPAAADLKKACAIAPEVEAWVKKTAAEMQETVAKTSRAPETHLDALTRSITAHRSSPRSN